MPIEIEAKFKVQSLQNIRERLSHSQGSILKIVLESNVFFDTPQKDLLKTDQGLRIRSMTDLQTGHVKVVSTHKGPRAKGLLKSRSENELEIESLEAGWRFFEAIGYVPTIQFEKKRETWVLGPVKVELDTLALLGFFIEIEGPSEQSVMEAAGLLGLANEKFLTESYAALLDAAVQADPSGCKSVTFAQYPV